MLKHILFFFESLLHVEHFFFFARELAADLGNLVPELLLKLHNALFAALQVKGLLPQLSIQRLHALHGVVEGGLTVTLLHLPRKRDLFNLLDLALFQIGFELGFFGPLPHLQLPHGLIVSLSYVAGHTVGTRRILSLPCLLQLRYLHRGSLAEIFEEQEHAHISLDLARLQVPHIKILVVNASRSLGRLLLRRCKNSIERQLNDSDVSLMASLDLMDETNVEHLLVEQVEQLGLRRIERVRGKAVLKFAVLRSGRDWRWRRRLELVHVLEVELVGAEHVGSHRHVAH